MLDITAGKTPYGMLGDRPPGVKRKADPEKSRDKGGSSANDSYAKSFKSDVFGSPNFTQQWSTPSMDKNKDESD